jgi:hypothetical protein
MAVQLTIVHFLNGQRPKGRDQDSMRLTPILVLLRRRCEKAFYSISIRQSCLCLLVEPFLIAEFIEDIKSSTEEEFSTAGKIDFVEGTVDIRQAFQCMDWNLILKVQEVTNNWITFRSRDGLAHCDKTYY